jgi:hypothetical protein
MNFAKRTHLSETETTVGDWRLDPHIGSLLDRPVHKKTGFHY